MYLKLIEIYGFKSFANRTKIEFYPGINIIVGPNGCGKSNIVDAIKWSIGEMSRKALRMPSLTDVIFAGTTKRQAMNLAEVTLVFDNTERKLPIAFDEVAITRKVYRNEESEYFINRVPCRLKDIREMFLDTGIGSNGYAIIDQGEIEEILLADPVKRREVIEEVAGISRYKAKREEALSKLEKVNLDLSIVENSVALIEQQIKKLEQDAKKAKLYQQYQQELRELEIATIVKTISELYSKIEEEKKLLEPVVKEISDITVEISQIEAEKTTKEIQLTEAADSDKDISEKIVSTKLEISQIESKVLNNEELIKEISSQLTQLEERRRRNSQLKEELIPQIERLREELAGFLNNQQNIEGEYLSVVESYNQLELDLKEIDQSISSSEAKTVEYYQKEIDISNNLARLESELAHIKEDILSLHADKEKLERQLSAVLNEIKTIDDEINRVNSQNEDAKKELEEFKLKKKTAYEDLERLEDENAKLSLEIASCESRLDTLIKDAQKDSYWVGTRECVEGGFDGVFGVLRNLIKFKGENSVVVEDIFGEFLDAVVVRDREVALRCIDYLRENLKGRARFLILSNIPHLVPQNPVIKELFETSPEFENLLHYLIGRVSLSGTTVTADVWISGGVDTVTSNEPYWSEIDSIKKDIEDKRARKVENDKRISELMEYLSELSGKMVEFENRIDEFEKFYAVLRSKSEDTLQRKKVLEENLEFINNEIGLYESKKEEIEKRISELKNELDSTKASFANLRAEIDILKQKRAEIEKSMMEKRDIVTSVKHRKDYLSHRISSITQNIDSLEKQLSQIEEEERGYLQNRSELEQRIRTLKEEISALKIKKEELVNDLREYEIERSRIENSMNEIRNYLSHLSSTLKENNEIIREKIEKRNEIELRINTLTTRIEDLKNKLEMEYASVYDAIKESYNSMEVDQKRIEYLKRRIENIGPVNMTAPGEYEELMKEYEEKMKQINDLKQAREDLKEAISKINQTTKESLRNTFNSINEHFKKIYTTLFNGGTANLIFTEPDNILESGVEIMACPPGKRLVNISQLSGGEKSLTAIALLFSFFCVNPSPFCVMDEVDAALDESNVERFVNLLKEFSPSTQFIVITHNKRTMEIADRIYGVTMEEIGVSKIISVDLKKAINMVENAKAVV